MDIFKLLICPILFLFSITLVNGQSENLPDFSEEIDVQLWEPFKKAYESNDGPAFVALHTDDVLRITKWGIQQGAEWKERTLTRLGQEGLPNRQIDFYFEHRIHSRDVAYEVGYFRIITPTEDGNKKKYYGRFSVLLKKADDMWKIAQDWDTDKINGVPITKEDFERLANVPSKK